MPPAKRPNPTIRDRELRARLAKRAQISSGKARQLAEVIKEELIRSLKSGNRIQIIDFGVFRRAAFPDRMMHDINRRGQRVLHRGGYYVSFTPSQALRSKLRAVSRPAANPQTDTSQVKIKYIKSSKPLEPTPEDAPAKDNDRGEEIKIIKNIGGTPYPKPDKSLTPDILPGNTGQIAVKVRPRISPLSWRTELPMLHLDLRGNLQRKPGSKLLKNFLRYITHHDSDQLSVAPHVLTFYGSTKSHTPIAPELYELVIDALRQHTPQLFKTHLNHRIIVELPPAVALNVAVLPQSDEDLVVFFQKPGRRPEDNGSSIHLGKIIDRQLDRILDRSQGRIAVIGTPHHRQKLIDALGSKFHHDGLACHGAGESHHVHGASKHQHTIRPSLGQTLRRARHDTILMIDSLSRADDWYKLDAFPGVVVANISAWTHDDLMNTLRRQKLSDDFFDLTLETVAIPALCRDCLPDFQPAVLYPSLRRCAAPRADRLEGSLVGKKSLNCRHTPAPRLLTAAYKGKKHIGQSIEDQIYQLVLDRELPVEALENLGE